jgi:hypothetical protein
VLNLDAENELEVGRGYAATRHIQRIVERERRNLLGTLVAQGDIVVGATELSAEEAERVRGLPGLAWSPTPSALTLLAQAGARPSAAPDFETLRTVNARAFAADVRSPLRAEAFEKHLVRDREQALAQLSRPAAEGWLVRRTFGAAGRGRRRIRAGKPGASELAWLARGFQSGPLIIEPWVTITREFTRSGWVNTDATVHSAAPCLQATTAAGAWTATECADAGALARGEDARLEEAFFSAGRALAEAGYFGPYGIDSYRYRSNGPGSPEILNPLSEINARFTMDWVTGMSDRQGLEARRGWIERA